MTDRTILGAAATGPVTADEIEPGDHILVRDGGDTFPARVASLARYHDGSGNKRTFWWAAADGRAGELTCASADQVTRVPAPGPPPGARHTVSEETITRAEGIASWALTSRLLGTPLPASHVEWITEDDAGAAVILAGITERYRAAGVLCFPVDDCGKIGVRVGFGGFDVSYLHVLDSVTRSGAYSSADLVTAGAA